MRLRTLDDITLEMLQIYPPPLLGIMDICGTSRSPDGRHLLRLILERKCLLWYLKKTHAPGHSYRHSLVSEILKTDLPIDIWGRGCNLYTQLDDRLKGEFVGNDTRIYSNYQYHIAIENFVTPHYYSEKILNPVMYNTIPIYLGCTNISNYMGDVLCLTGNLQEDINLLTNICNKPKEYTKYRISRTNVLEQHSIRNVLRSFMKH